MSDTKWEPIRYVGMKIENPMWSQWEADRKAMDEHFKQNETAEVPSWMTFEVFAAIKKIEREEAAKKLIAEKKRNKKWYQFWK